MADYRAVVRKYPPALEYLRKASWIRRGDVLSYAPNLLARNFTTDAFGFRHTQFFGRDISVSNALEFKKVGLLLGSSHVFGFGLAGNEHSLASRLSQALKMPVFGISFPEADTRTLTAVAQRLFTIIGGRLKLIMLATGGDYTRYCYTGQCDAMFGPPVLPRDERTIDAPVRLAPFDSLIAFSAYWVEMLNASVQAFGARCTLVEDLTFFEKPRADAAELECGLGAANDAPTQQRFERHIARVYDFGDARRHHAAKAGIGLLKFPPQAEVRFIDEFHYRSDSIVEIANKIAAELL